MTAGILAERITKETWEDVIQERIFTPLGMIKSTFTNAEGHQEENFSYGYGVRGGEFVRLSYRNSEGVRPAGSVQSSADEMARYVLLFFRFANEWR